MFPLVGVQLILIPYLGKSIANPPHSIIAPCCFRNSIPISALYFTSFPTNILFPFVCTLSTARSTVHSLWLSDHDSFFCHKYLGWLFHCGTQNSVGSDKGCTYQVCLYHSCVKQYSSLFSIDEHSSFESVVSFDTAWASGLNLGRCIAFEFQGIDVYLIVFAMSFRQVRGCLHFGWCIPYSFVVLARGSILPYVPHHHR